MRAEGERSAVAVGRGPRAVGLAVAVVVGVGTAVQSRINGELGGRIDDGLIAAFVSFAGGLLLLVALAVLRPRVRSGLGRVAVALRDRRLRPYQLSGGLFGAFVVTCQGLTVTVIGVAVFTVAVVAGQAVSGLLVDRAGVGPAGPQPVTALRIAGSALALAAVVLAVSDRFGTPAALWPAVLPALAGVGIAWQQAVNGRVGAAAGQDGHPLAGMLPAALVNFGVGTAALVLVVAVEVAIRGLPATLPTQPWLYLGGLLGMLFISAAAAIVPITGVLLLGLGTVAGQLLGALLLDVFLPATDGRPPGTALAGTALALLAVMVTARPGRRRG